MEPRVRALRWFDDEILFLKMIMGTVGLCVSG
jgi:hypothetical protein